MAVETIRQKIVDRVMLRLRDIRTENGYQTDIGYNVHDWRVNYEDDELPAVSVCDLMAEAVSVPKPSGGGTIWQMPLQIRIFAERRNTPAEIRTMIADVYRAIRQDDRWGGEDGKGLVMATQPKTDGFLIPDDSFEVIGGAVEVDIQYFTHKFNPEIATET